MIYHNLEEIFESIAAIREKLVSKVSILSDQEASFRSSENQWSAAQLVEHLAKTEESLLKAIGRFLEQAEAEGVPANPNGQIEPPVSFAEIGQKAAGQKFNAPERIRPMENLSIAASLAHLAESRAQLLALRPRFAAVDLSNTKFPHPAFGPLNLYYWLAFIGMHEARHLKQIEETLPTAKAV